MRRVKSAGAVAGDGRRASGPRGRGSGRTAADERVGGGMRGTRLRGPGAPPCTWNMAVAAGLNSFRRLFRRRSRADELTGALRRLSGRRGKEMRSNGARA